MERTWEVCNVYDSRSYYSFAVIDSENNRLETEHKQGGNLEKVYNIYIKDECVYHNLPEEVFQTTWEQLNGMVGLMKTEYNENDLSYRESEVYKIGLTD